MAIDKPAGMIVHGDGTGERTLTDYASDLLLAMGDGFAATDMQPLNRLDRNTTGVVLFSLDKQTQPAFDQMVIDHAFEKHYLALAEGKIDWNEKLIDKPIARDRHDSRKMRVGASGKPSQTRVKVQAPQEPPRSAHALVYRCRAAHRPQAPNPCASGERASSPGRRRPVRHAASLRPHAPCPQRVLHASRNRRAHPHRSSLPLGALKPAKMGQVYFGRFYLGKRQNHHKGSCPFAVVLALSRSPVARP